jgi:hypothetical protein
LATLDGTGTPIDLAPGYRLAAPGLVGSADAVPPRQYGGADRGPESATAAFEAALTAAGVSEVLNVELQARPEAGAATRAPVRTSAGEPAMVLETPDLGDEVGQVVMAIDEDGTVTWNFPEGAEGDIETPAVRGAGGTKRFVIRNTTPAPSTDSGADRGLFAMLGRKVLKVLVFPVTDVVLGRITESFAARWEAANRPYLVRSFGVDDYDEPAVEGLSDGQWEMLAGGRALLFVHGTFSTTHSGFAGLPRDTVARLLDRYQGRLFGFDHHTLSATPEDNVAEFAARMPDGLSLDIDIVSHSRGGLVARTFSDELHSAAPGVSVGRSVFVATPNNGTALASADHMIDFIDRSTSALNVLPPGPLSVVGSIFEAILTVVKMVGHAFLTGLRGLTSMDPGGGFLARLNTGTAVDSEYYAVAAEFEPTGGLRDLVKTGPLDALVDRVFGDDANDLVVPTLGVYSGGTDVGFPIPSPNVHVFDRAAGISHTTFFSAPKTNELLLTWLQG